MTNRPFCCCLPTCVTAVFVVALTAASLSADDVDYVRDIQPLLTAKCFQCHGPDKQESGLRLDTRRQALAGGDGGISIMPGKGANSELIRRVSLSDDDDRMPPEGKRLSAVEVELLSRWIDQGARGIPEHAAKSAVDRHWAFQPILRPSVPKIADAVWPRNGIDRFVLAKLKEHSTEPSPAAPAEILIRRLYLVVCPHRVY